jgi:hypothetical protein
MLTKSRTLHLKTSKMIPSRFGESHKFEVEGHGRRRTRKLAQACRKGLGDAGGKFL